MRACAVSHLIAGLNSFTNRILDSFKGRHNQLPKLGVSDNSQDIISGVICSQTLKY